LSWWVEAISTLKEDYPAIYSPQSRPLSPGEILGCTSPKIQEGFSAIIYLADGRFHLESIMIANPDLPAYRYDPYSKVFSIEKYDNTQMLQLRKKAIENAKTARKVGVIHGTLGRQGNSDVVNRMVNMLHARNIVHVVVLLSEIFPSKLELFNDIDAWIQVSCPRLSIDWGHAFNKPLLNSYEATIAYGNQELCQVYPMDYYSANGGTWSVYYKPK